MNWPLPAIMCARCGQPVDETVVWDCPANSPGTIEVVVYCHGATESVKVDKQIFTDPLATIVQATAFASRPALTARMMATGEAFHMIRPDGTVDEVEPRK